MLRKKPKGIAWELDVDGDWQLRDGGRYIGMVCPHNPKWIKVVVDGNILVGDSNTVPTCKKYLEKWWSIEKKGNDLKEKLWGKK